MQGFKVLASDKVSDLGLKALRKAGIQADMITGQTEDELCKIIPAYDALVVRSATTVTERVIEAAKNLKIIGRAGVGVDNINLNAATQRGIIVVNSPQGNTIAAAEHTWSMVLSMARMIPQACASMGRKKWDRKSFMGFELSGKTLGIVGFGNIGRKVCQYARAMGMHVLAYDPFVSALAAERAGAKLRSFEDIIKESDVLTLHLPVTKETKGLINAANIAKMRRGVYIVNVSRGPVVVEADLAAALKSGHVAGAALDVFNTEPPEPSNPLLKMPNVIVTPHLGASTKEAQVKVAVDVCEQIVEVLRGGPARSAVNIPSMRPHLIQPVKPFLSIAEKLGIIASATSGGKPQQLTVEFGGELFRDVDVAPLTTVTLKGLLGRYVEDGTVNFVNAPVVAKQMGLSVKAVKAPSTNFKSVITVRVASDQAETEVAGTVFDDLGDRLVRFHGFEVDIVPEGNLLITFHRDVPGVIGELGTFLGKKNVNIAAMDVGRMLRGGAACMVCMVDAAVSANTLEELCAKPNVSGAWTVRLPRGPEAGRAPQARL
eukprot:TRINITY_DN1044_c0_g2_i1.p1 TRINITY_DN1044_c0_g2~~TRINITY_DN1044_c0_g2_i1.p1  ORF type:complete len:545 (+),score=218.73 TRINITY_DN1044_c0_g2_i1:92-1726(+)